MLQKSRINGDRMIQKNDWYEGLANETERDRGLFIFISIKREAQLKLEDTLK
jgi:hypothetical protein